MTQATYYGWRGTIGMMTPSSILQVEFHKKAPKGVAVCSTLLPLPEPTASALIEMGKHVEEAASLLAQARPDIILFGCTIGSLIKGVGYDKDIIGRIERTAGIRATTTTSAVLEALQVLKAKKLSITTPYLEELNQAERSFLEKSGFEVVSIKGLGIGDKGIKYVRPEEMYRFTRDNFNEDSDVAFISCTGLSVFDIIEPLEKDLKKPVITSVQVSLWAALRKIHVWETIDGLGELFKL